MSEVGGGGAAGPGFERPGRGRRSGVVVVLVVAVTGLLALGARVAGPQLQARDPESPAPPAGLLEVGGDERADDPRVPAMGTWTPIPDAPVAARWGALSVWTGGELLVWGGYAGDPPDGMLEQDANPRVFPAAVRAGLAPLRDGAAFDPTTRRWRVLAPPPLDVPHDVRAVLVGQDMVLVGGEPGTPLMAWAYDPAADAWRTLPPAPLPAVEGAQVVAAGETVLVWGAGRDADQARDGAAQVEALAVLDPAAGTWRLTTAPPPIDTDAIGVWTGREVLLFDAVRGMAYDPEADTWRMLSRPPTRMRERARVAVALDGDVFLAGAYPFRGEVGYGYRYRTARDRWDLQPLPEPPDELFPAIAAVGTGERVVVLHRYPPRTAEATALVWQPGGPPWQLLAPDPVVDRRATAQAWTGEELVVWGGLDGDTPQAGGAAWRP